MVRTKKKEIYKLVKMFVGSGKSKSPGVEGTEIPDDLKEYHPGDNQSIETTLGIDKYGIAYIKMKLDGDEWASEAYDIFEKLKFQKHSKKSLKANYDIIEDEKVHIIKTDFIYTLVSIKMKSKKYMLEGRKRLKQVEKLTWLREAKIDKSICIIKTKWIWIDYIDGR